MSRLRVFAAGLLASFLSIGSISSAFADSDDNFNMNGSQIGRLLHSGQISPQQAAQMQAQMSGNFGWNQASNGSCRNHNTSMSWQGGQGQGRGHGQGQLRRMIQAQQQQQALANGQYGSQYSGYGQPYFNASSNPYGTYNANYNQGYQANGYGYSPYANNSGGIGSVVGNLLNSNGNRLPYSNSQFGTGGSGLGGLQNLFSNF